MNLSLSISRCSLQQFLLAVVFGLLSLSAEAQETLPPDTLVKNVTLEVIELISKDKELQSGDQKRMVELIEAKVLPHFDFTAMTRLAVATNWDKANAEQKKLLTDEFRTLLVRTYSSALASYRDQKFDFRENCRFEFSLNDQRFELVTFAQLLRRHQLLVVQHLKVERAKFEVQILYFATDSFRFGRRPQFRLVRG